MKEQRSRASWSSSSTSTSRGQCTREVSMDDNDTATTAAMVDQLLTEIGSKQRRGGGAGVRGALPAGGPSGGCVSVFGPASGRERGGADAAQDNRLLAHQ